MDIQKQRNSINPSDWIPGQVLLGDFVVERVLGEGGMGKVYLVKSQTTNMRFAVKRSKGLKEKDRRNFLAELQTWIDLPEHPNLVACRFFRTVGDEVLIFAEYVEGGSLKEWIVSRKLYAGESNKALERILNIAIQFAWGLHCVHELGLVHQDVKPANVMMVNDTQSAVQGLSVRVMDFGLARARATGGDQPLSELGRSVLVSSGGYTPAYCSPEQAAGRKLDRRTDMWSWGVSILEMFQGDVVWQSGRVAAKALEAFLKYHNKEVGIPAIPASVVSLLKGCFFEDPAQRWQSMEVVVQKLKRTYQAKIGAEYNRDLVKIDSKNAPLVDIGKRFGRECVTWTNPKEWLTHALEAEGCDPTEAARIVEKSYISRRGQLVADLGVYDEARRIYERLIRGGRNDLEIYLAALCMSAAAVHLTADDSSGALALYDRAIEIHERLVNVEDYSELSGELAIDYLNKAVLVETIGDNRTAVTLYDRAIEIHKRLVNVEGRREFAEKLAIDYLNKAGAIMNLGDHPAAVGLCDQGIKILERLVNVDGRRELANQLAKLYMNKANAVAQMRNHRDAAVLYDMAIKIREHLVNTEGQHELAEGLAKLYMNKANTVARMGDNKAAAVLYDLAIEIYKRLIDVEGRCELTEELAILYMNKAVVIEPLDVWAAGTFYSKSIEIFEWLVNIEGRRELAERLAKIYIEKANVIGRMGDLQNEVALYDMAVKILERLVNVDGRRELANELAKIYEKKAITVGRLGDKQTPVTLFLRAAKILDNLVNIEGQRKLAGDLARVKVFYGGSLVFSGHAQEGKREIREAVTVLREEVNRNGRADLKWVLDLAEKQLAG